MSLAAIRNSRATAIFLCAALLGFAGRPALCTEPGARASTRNDAGSRSRDAAPAASSDAVDVHQGQFESDGKPVEDFYCVPGAPGAQSAVILLHGAVPRGAGDEYFAAMCRGLAAAGYYAMFVEYYSQAGPAHPGDPPATQRNFMPWVNQNLPTWTGEVTGAIDALGHDPAVEPERIALMGFSLGGFLAVAVGAEQGGRVAAVIEYYGGMFAPYKALAANMPPTLIQHGAADRTVPVRYAYELDALLTRHERAHEMFIYPGVGHGFGEADRGEAWRRSLAFLRDYLGK